MTNETVAATPVSILCGSHVAELRLTEPQSDLGVEVMRGGLAATETGEILGWVATARIHDSLEFTPRSRSGPIELMRALAGPAIVEVVYRGVDVRRGAAAVNSHLIDRCGLGATRVESEAAELSWRTAHGRAERPRLRLAG